jgi:hypothetical protein
MKFRADVELLHTSRLFKVKSEVILIMYTHHEAVTGGGCITVKL